MTILTWIDAPSRDRSPSTVRYNTYRECWLLLLLLDSESSIIPDVSGTRYSSNTPAQLQSILECSNSFDAFGRRVCTCHRRGCTCQSLAVPRGESVHVCVAEREARDVGREACTSSLFPKTSLEFYCCLYTRGYDMIVIPMWHLV